MYSVSTAKNSVFYILHLTSHTVNASVISLDIQGTQFTCLKSTTEALEKYVKYVESYVRKMFEILDSGIKMDYTS